MYYQLVKLYFTKFEYLQMDCFVNYTDNCIILNIMTNDQLTGTGMQGRSHGLF